MSTSPPPVTPEEPVEAPVQRGMQHAVSSFGSTLLIGLLSAVVISRLYGVDVLGAFALVASAYALVSQTCNFGEQVALVRALTPQHRVRGRALAALAVVLSASVLVTALVALAAGAVTVLLLRGPADQPQLVEPALVLLSAYVLLGRPSWVCDMAQVALRRTAGLLSCRLFDGCFLLLASVVLAWAREPDVHALVQAQVLTMAVGLLLRLVLLRDVLAEGHAPEEVKRALGRLRDDARFGLRVVPGAAAQALTQQAGIWIIGAVRPLAVLGAYSRANNLANRLTDVGYRLSEVVLPSLERDCERADHTTACVRFSRWRLFVVLTLLGLCAPLAGAAQGLLLIFGPGFAQAAVPLGLLLLAYAAGVVTALQAQFLFALRQPGTVSRLSLLRAVIVLALVAPLTLAGGAAGAAAAVLVGYACELAVSLRATERALREHAAATTALPWWRLLVVGGVSLLVAGQVDAVLPDVGGGLLAATSGAAAFLVVAWVLKLQRLVRDLALPSAAPASTTR